MNDLRQAVRSLIKTPFLTAVAVLSLGLGIGANGAIFSLFEQMLLRSLPAAEPDRLVNLAAPGPKPGSQSCNQAGECDAVFSYPMYRDLESDHPGLSGIAAHRAFGANLAQGDRTVNGSGMMVSGSYFPLLGVRPALGRLLQPADDVVPGEHDVVVLSHRFWQNQLGGDPAVLNSTLVVNGRGMTIVGVAAPGFQGTTLGSMPDVFVPLSMRRAIEPLFDGFDNRRSYWIYVFGRLAPGVSIEQASASLNQVYSGIVNETEAELQTGMSEATLAEFRGKRVVLEPGRRGQSSVHQEAATPLLLLLGTTVLVLLIACANIANLLLARGARRSGEMAIRGSLGAGRGQLIRQLMTESLLLAFAGGVASLAVARGTLAYIGSILPDAARSSLQLEIQPAVLLFTAVVTMGTGLLFGLYPAVHATRTDLLSTLRGAAGQTSGGRSVSRFRTVLVTAQIALSMALLVAAGLFIRSLHQISRVDLGLETENMVTFAVAPVLNGYEPERSRILFERLEEDLRAIPGVSGVTSSMVPVLGGSSWGTDVAVEGFQAGPDKDSNSRLNEVGPGYFRTMGTPLMAGREFTTADAAGGAEVAVVNEAFARKFGFDRQSAVGRLMSRSGSSATELDVEIVGIVQDARYNSVKDEVPAVFFTPHRQNESLGFLFFYVRTTGDPGSTIRAVPDVVKRIDPNLPVEELKTLEQQAGESVSLDRIISILSAAFAAIATLLASIGLYGVLSYTVAQRTREFGLRMALGAGSPLIRTLVLRQVGWMLLIGGSIGIAAALAMGRAAESLLYQLEGNDPLAFVSAVIVLTGVALLAGWIPAFRASRVDPMQALRYE